MALVVGNFAYVHVPRLSNPGNDATLVATTLRQLGFTLIGDAAQENLDKIHFDQAVQAFGRAIQGADVALFYYAGHGLQVDGTNWLVPTDANPTRPQDLDFQMVNADLVLQQMNGAGTRLNMVVLDACRNNPFGMLGTRAVAGGLAQMKAPEGTIIAFATQPGNVATDGSGADGPYAMALTASMRQPGLDIFQTFNHVGLTVQHQTNGVQVPWVSSSPIDGEFYFTAGGGAAEEIAEAVGDPASALAPAASSPTPNGAGATTRGDSPIHAPVSAAAAQTTTQPTQPDAAAVTRLQSLQAEAAQGKADAQIDLGLAYAKGLGVARDDTIARQWFDRAAQQGMAKAQYYMGAMVERGRGGPRSYASALQWYQRAADQGYPSAEAAIGRFYARGLGVPRDLVRRTDWDRRAAMHGAPLGQWALGNFYQFGNGVPKDMALAVQWYERAAKQGFVPAELRLGILYENGIAVPRDYAQAIYWFRKAADSGNTHALNSLGVFYRRGLGVPRDYKQAMQFFHQAADKGSPMAEFNIGLLYANGHGVRIDKQQAHLWFEKAAAAGNQSAIDLLARQQDR